LNLGTCWDFFVRIILLEKEKICYTKELVKLLYLVQSAWPFDTELSKSKVLIKKSKIKVPNAHCEAKNAQKTCTPGYTNKTVVLESSNSH